MQHGAATGRSTAAGAADGPGIRFPPPFVFLSGFVATWLLNQRVMFPIDGKGARAPQLVIGYLAIAAGLALAAWGIATFRKARVSVMPIRPASQLVTWGPFRRSRNPLYVAMTFVYFGAAVVVNWAWPIVLLPIVLIVMNVAIIEREERYLAATFPGAYETYCAATPRWL